MSYVKKVGGFGWRKQKCVPLLHEVTKRVYIIGNERMLIAHDSNRLRFS